MVGNCAGGGGVHRGGISYNAFNKLRGEDLGIMCIKFGPLPQEHDI